MSRSGSKRQPATPAAAQNNARWLSKRRRLRPRDVIATATLGPRTRLVRSMLSALGIAIGIAALVAMLGIPASQQAQVDKELEAMGANLTVVYPGQDSQTGEVYPLPDEAPAMLERIRPVTAVVTLRSLDDTKVYRNDKIPAGQSGYLTAAVAEGDLLGTLNVALAAGRWFDSVSATMPTVVLGQDAADNLKATVGQRIWIDQRWWAVIGVLEPNDLASELNTTAFLAPERASQLYQDLPIQTIYVAALPGKAKSVKAVAAATANPANARGVQVMGNEDWYWTAELVETNFRNLALGLGSVALLVGAIGIANTMVVAVMERRSEIGLRRAMGARTGQIALQFVLEASVIGFAGGVIGIGLGAYLVFLYTTWIDLAFAIPTWVLVAGPGISLVVGALSGLYPSLKAARVSPTVALRAI